MEGHARDGRKTAHHELVDRSMPVPSNAEQLDIADRFDNSHAARLRSVVLEHVHRTMHFQGERTALEAMARACLGVGLAEIEAAFR